MKNVFLWIVRVIVLLLIIKVIAWSWQEFRRGGKEGSLEEVLDVDRECRVTNPDLGSCVCVHRRTRELLSVPYEECVESARSMDGR